MRWRPMLKPLFNRVVPPLIKYYLRKPRNYSYEGLEMLIPPGVFHPGLYLSTQFMLDELKQKDLKGKTALELGAGSGLISLWLARSGARMTSSDIHPGAVDNLRRNAESNQIELEVVESDLFSNLPERRFDWILINPPYYPSDPKAHADHAWYCGSEFQYFKRLFLQLEAHVTRKGEVWMVLSEDCELERIGEIGKAHGWKMEEFSRRKKWGEWNYIYRLSQ